ncbi:ANK REP REGION domain-containing protein [Citrus sinensis]|uniref:ANK REP REGION domain-containing protein n=1 Tax=Citrus sinensis TaxID=2711 RepID=A0ACB8J7I9_CITSI|nr:ANK REP REGION domain-containing protein [Citrus sinensis]
MDSNESTRAQEQSNEGDNQTPKAKDQKIIEDIASHVQVTRCVLQNDWKGLERYIMSKTPEALTNRIIAPLTIFDFIVASDAPATLLEKLLSRVPPDLLQELMSDEKLFFAVGCGNKNIMEILMRYKTDLPNVKHVTRLHPVHYAALLGLRDAVDYLLPKTIQSLDGHDAITLLKFLINSNLFDMALALLKKHPNIARTAALDDIRIILESLSKKPKAFASGSRLGYWKRLLYQWIPTQEEYNPHPHPHYENADGDVEKQLSVTSNIHLAPQKIATAFGSLRQKLKIVLWNNIMQLAPGIKSIRDTKLTQEQTLEILRIMCAGAVGNLTTHEEAEKILKTPMFTAARWGIYEIVIEIILSYFPASLYFENKDQHNVFDAAVEHRQQKVFNIIFNMPKQLTILRVSVANFDAKLNNALHLAARSVPSSEVPGAALQMQRELQWFKAVENIVHPTLQDQLNNEDKTPRELFTKAHEELVKEGEKWMKDTAQSCSLVAALIITIAFAAAITVPGGSDSRGMPNYLHEPSFTIFGISNALALFSSVISVLMFLGILTSRFSEEDFLVSLPKKLIIGLITLFFSIASLMVAFAATVYIVQFHSWKWVIIPMGLLGFLPVSLFATLQFPLLIEVFSSTYGPGIFKPIKYVRM